MAIARPVAALLAVALTAAACGGSGGGTSPDPTSPDPTSQPDPGTPSTAPSEPPPERALGPELDAATFAPGSATFVWQVDGALLVTNTRGTSIGHLPGWVLDRGASDRLAAPVIDGPGGERVVVTVDGLVDPAQGVPLSGGSVAIGDTDAEVRDAGGAVVATLAFGDPAHVWVSATGTVVGVLGGEAWDLEAGGAARVEEGCRVADRHEVEAPLLVCDDGARLTGGTSIAAPDGARFGWVTVGTTGDEVLATLHRSGQSEVVLGSRSAGRVDALVDGPSAAIFFRSSGTAWIARFGVGGGLLSLQADGSTTPIVERPGVMDVAAAFR